MTTDIATTGNVAYVTAGDTIPATQNVAYGQVPPSLELMIVMIMLFNDVNL